MSAVDPVPNAGEADPSPWKARKAWIPIIVASCMQSSRRPDRPGDGAWDNDDTLAVIAAAITALVVYLVRNPRSASAAPTGSNQSPASTLDPSTSGRKRAPTAVSR